jgi:hypothetical protein
MEMEGQGQPRKEEREIRELLEKLGIFLLVLIYFSIKSNFNGFDK